MCSLPTCPSEPGETAEAYVRLSLSTQEAESFRAHLDACEDCRQRVVFYEEYVEAMRAAATSFEGDGGALAPKRGSDAS